MIRRRLKHVRCFRMDEHFVDHGYYRVVRFSDIGLKLVRNSSGFFFIYYSSDLVIPLPLIINRGGGVCWSSQLAFDVFDLVVKSSRDLFN